MIYFVQIDIPNGPVKIGYATKPEKRIKQLQKQMPWRLKILKTIEGTQKEESRFHWICRRYRIVDSSGREWFTPECLSLLRFREIIAEKNLTADKLMTPEQTKEYLNILIDCAKGSLNESGLRNGSSISG
jgi:hypothetical protein